jgi:hypothetical protein
MPVASTEIFPAVIVAMLEPKSKDEVPRLDKAIAPPVAVKFKLPPVRVKLLEAVKVSVEVNAPKAVVVTPD